MSCLCYGDLVGWSLQIERKVAVSECVHVRGVECDGVRGMECDGVMGVECDGVRPRLLWVLAGLVSLEGESPTPTDRREEMSLTESFGPAWVLADLLQINMI